MTGRDRGVGCNGVAVHQISYDAPDQRVSTPTPKMAEYDLSKTIIPYLDRHLVFPLLAHLTESSIFPSAEVQVAQYELAKGTDMFDYAASLFKEINPDKEVPAGISPSRVLFQRANGF